MTITASSSATFDVMRVREDFPILQRRVRGKPLVYLDNAATTQKPQSVIDRIVRYYREENANIHRGVHALSVEATDAYDAARERVQRFINAAEAREIVFVRGATEAINLVAATYGRAHLQRGDEVLISAMEHHSNIVPWQMICEEQAPVCASCRSPAAVSCGWMSTNACSGRARASSRSRMCPTHSARLIR